MEDRGKPSFILYTGTETSEEKEPFVAYLITLGLPATVIGCRAQSYQHEQLLW